MDQPQPQLVRVKSGFGDKLLKFVIFCNQFIWLCIGIVIFGGIVTALVIGPDKIFKKAASSAIGIPEGLIGNENKSQQEIIESLPKDKQDCIKNFFGADRFEELRSGKAEPNEEESKQVASQCLLGSN